MYAEGLDNRARPVAPFRPGAGSSAHWASTLTSKKGPTMIGYQFSAGGTKIAFEHAVGGRR
jgi:hypothetical protein